ncbi:hypothetical protein [Cupriavidus sp. 8B]
MSNIISGFTFALFSTLDFEGDSIAKNIVDVILSAPGDVSPKKMGAFEPKEIIGSTDDVVDILVNRSGPKTGMRSGSLLLEAGKECGFQVQWDKSEKPGFHVISGHLMFSAIVRDSTILCDFMDVIRALVGVVKPVYGEVRSMATKGWDAPVDLLVRLPDVPIISIYGVEYINLFGRDRIESAPFLKIERFDEYYWLVAHDVSPDGVPDSVRNDIRRHLGEDAFMADGKWKYKFGSAPKFDLRNSVAE